MARDDNKIICEHCGHPNRQGALICRSCYRMLTKDGRLPGTTNKLKTGPLDKKAQDDVQVKAPNLDAPPPAPSKPKISRLRLLNVHTGHELRMPFPSGTLMVGRADTERNIMPDIDLTLFGAHQKGVSRTHMLLRKESSGRVLVRDLNTPNSTYINGEKLAPNLPVLLRHGDVLRLGNLIMLVYFE